MKLKNKFFRRLINGFFIVTFLTLLIMIMYEYVIPLYEKHGLIVGIPIPIFIIAYIIGDKIDFVKYFEDE